METTNKTQIPPSRLAQPGRANPPHRPAQPALDAPPRRHPLGTRILRGLTLLFAPLIVPCCAIYNKAARRVLHRDIEQTPRDPQTGVILGAEAVSIFAEADPGGGSPLIHRLPDASRESGEALRSAADLFLATASTPAANDTAVSTERAPATAAVLLIHGFLGSRKDLADLGDRLASGGLFVRITRLPGHGTTPQDFATQTPETLLSGVMGEYEALRERFGEVYVAGFSMGGTLATLLAARVPVDRLVLIAPSYGIAHMWYYGLAAETWHALMGRFVPWAIKSEAFIKLSRTEARKELFSYRAIPKTGVDTLIRLSEAARDPATLAAITCPVLMVISRGDEASSPARAREAFARLASPDKTALWLHHRNNHHILWDHDREEAIAAIVDFLARD